MYTQMYSPKGILSSCFDRGFHRLDEETVAWAEGLLESSGARFWFERLGYVEKSHTTRQPRTHATVVALRFSIRFASRLGVCRLSPFVSSSFFA